jgi:rRNA maturation endonuclease Nob1
MTLFGGIIRGIAERREREAREAVITFVLALLLSLIIYCVPVLIYRFGIRHGAPLESKWKATWVGWIFWVCSFTTLCLYYLITGYYDDGDFSVRAGLLDFLCLSINWFLLYVPFKKTLISKSKCAKCGAPLSPNAKFCAVCGEKYVPKPVVNTMICPGCGKTIKRTNFCPECGHHLTTTDQAVDQIAKYSRTKSTTIPVGMIVCPGCCNTVTEGKRCPLCNYQLEDDEPRDPTFQEMFGDGIILKDDKPRRINFSNPVTIVILIWAAFAAAFALLMFLSN